MGLGYHSNLRHNDNFPLLYTPLLIIPTSQLYLSVAVLLSRASKLCLAFVLVTFFNTRAKQLTKVTKGRRGWLWLTVSEGALHNGG